MPESQQLTLAHFVPALNQTFHLHLKAQRLDLTLSEAEPIRGHRFGERAPFALLFRGPAAPILSQQIYALEHERLGQLELFLVPVGREGPNQDESRPVLYEAVFN